MVKATVVNMKTTWMRHCWRYIPTSVVVGVHEGLEQVDGRYRDERHSHLDLERVGVQPDEPVRHAEAAGGVEGAHERREASYRGHHHQITDHRNIDQAQHPQEVLVAGIEREVDEGESRRELHQEMEHLYGEVNVIGDHRDPEQQIHGDETPANAENQATHRVDEVGLVIVIFGFLRRIAHTISLPNRSAIVYITN